MWCRYSLLSQWPTGVRIWAPTPHGWRCRFCLVPTGLSRPTDAKYAQPSGKRAGQNHLKKTRTVEHADTPRASRRCRSMTTPRRTIVPTAGPRCPKPDRAAITAAGNDCTLTCNCSISRLVVDRTGWTGICQRGHEFCSGPILDLCIPDLAGFSNQINRILGKRVGPEEFLSACHDPFKGLPVEASRHTTGFFAPWHSIHGHLAIPEYAHALSPGPPKIEQATSIPSEAHQPPTSVSTRTLLCPGGCMVSPGFPVAARARNSGSTSNSEGRRPKALATASRVLNRGDCSPFSSRTRVTRPMLAAWASVFCVNPAALRKLRTRSPKGSI